MAPLVRSGTRMPAPLPRTAAALALVAASLVLAPVAPARHEPPALAAKLLACGDGPDPAGRFGVFRGTMPARDGARRLAMRFDLERRGTGGEGWRRVPAPTFGRWERSEPGVPGFVYTKRVEGLTAPADYRAVVRFRWIAADGAVVRTARRVSRACAQRDTRPDLVLQELLVAADRRMVTVVVRNGGGSTTGPGALLAVTVDGLALPERELAPLEPGDELTLTFPLAAACTPGSTVVATADPRDAVAEPSERDNRRVAQCS